MREYVLPILGAAAVALFIAVFGTGAIPANPPSTATTTIAVMPPISLPSLSLPPIEEAATSSALTKPKSTAPVVSSPAPVAPSTPVSPPVSQAQLAAASASLRAALVNIICLVPMGSQYESISGSGVIVSSTGMILTNAHVAQYFLLANEGVSCVIRTGSPATATYDAQLAYISPEWLNANSNVINEANPTGTGQYDFAILAIDGSATNTPLPFSFPSVSLEYDEPTVNEQVVIGSYAAQFLQTSQIESSLDATFVYGSVKDVYTFSTTTVDVVSLGGSAAAQEGSSGGGVVDGQDELAATITTTTTAADTADRNLNAITASYIRREYESETGYSLDSLLSESSATAISDFAPQIPHLESLITSGSVR